ncbi:MAG: MBL fold metallo-hydrolase [Pseudomonadota bacterium]
MNKIIKIVAGLGAAIVVAGVVAYGVVWTMPSLQDRLMVRMIKSRAPTGAVNPILKDGQMHIFFCGTGSPMPDPTRANACSAVVAGGHIVIIDTGPGSWAKFARSRLPASAIDTVLLTHLHSDHIGDLGEFAVQSWIAGRPKPLDVWGPSKLPVSALAPDSTGHYFGTSGTDDLVKGFAIAYDADAAYRIDHHGVDYLNPNNAGLVGHEIPTPKVDELVTVYEKDGLKISAFLVNHHPIEPAYGFRAEYKGRVVVFSGDTKKTESVERFSKGADVLVHEALNPHMLQLISKSLTEIGNQRLGKMSNDTINYHTSPVEAAEIANEDGVKLLVYSHIVPPLPTALSEHMFMRGVPQARGKGDTKIAFDGMMLSLAEGSDEIEVTDLR